MLPSRDTSDIRWGRTCDSGLETMTTESHYAKFFDKFPKTRLAKTFSSSFLPQRQTTKWPPEPVSMVLEFEELKEFQETNDDPGETEGLVLLPRMQQTCKHGHKMKPIRSNPCTAKLNLKDIFGVFHKTMICAVNKLDKESPNANLQRSCPTSRMLYKTAERNGKVYFDIITSPDVVTKLCLSNIYLVNNYMAVISTKPDSRTHKKNTSIIVNCPKMEYSRYNLSSNKGTFLGPVQEKSSLLREDNQYNKCRSVKPLTCKSSVIMTMVPNFQQQCGHPKKEKHEEMLNSKKVIEEYEGSLHRQTLLPYLKVLIGPYAQIQTVYNVIEQTGTKKKEKGTSQQFKQKSQGVGSGSVSDVNDSSSASSKRRTIKIESGISFSVEFVDKGKKSSGSDVSSHEPEPDIKKKEGKEKKKSLHRCLCTTSFSTDDKKLKNKPCDRGVCEPGKCSASECFKRLQQKYGSKKKSDSDISSSQASQTSKKKERAGKEKVVKEKGSSSISKYKETVEEKTLPKKEPEKFNIVKCMTECCNKLQFWKKDKSIELKPAVIGTDISVKDETKSFGSNAATQSGKKGKKDVKGKGKDVKGETVTEEKATGKKGKKDVKGKGKDVKGETVTEEKATGKKGKKVKEGVTKKPAEKKPKKKVASKEEVKTETKATGKEMKKARPLRPYECEPGVCSPKVCIPKECYERKFPPPPPPQKVSSLTKFKNCLRKMCCKRPIGQDKTDSGLHAATQSRKAAPEKPPGVTVYQEKGTSSSKKRIQKGETPAVPAPVDTTTTATESRKSKKRGKQKTDTGIQLPVDSGDVPIDGKKSKKPTAYSGIEYFQTVDPERMTTKQGLNIGSECSCSVEFYKMLY